MKIGDTGPYNHLPLRESSIIGGSKSSSVKRELSSDVYEYIGEGTCDDEYRYFVFRVSPSIMAEMDDAENIEL